MPDQSANLPDNLISRVSRLHVDDRQFKDENGETVKYSRLIVGFSVNDTPVEIELKVDRKDKLLLSVADRAQGARL